MAKKSTELAVRETAAITTWEEEMAKEAADAAAKEVVSTKKISFSSDGIKLGDTKLQNPLKVIVADYCFENAYYSRPFNPKNPVPPDCYAFGRDEDELKPHPKSASPQHDNCKGCPMNQWGSADNSEKGKACKNQRRLMVVSGDVQPDAVAQTDVLMALVPPTSLNAWAKFVKGLRDVGLPPWGSVTELESVKHETYFKLTFNPVAKVTQQIYAGLKARKKEIEEQMMAPYREAEAKPAKGKSKKF